MIVHYYNRVRRLLAFLIFVVLRCSEKQPHVLYNKFTSFFLFLLSSVQKMIIVPLLIILFLF
jgi:hypothetical protein